MFEVLRHGDQVSRVEEDGYHRVGTGDTAEEPFYSRAYGYNGLNSLLIVTFLSPLLSFFSVFNS